MKTLATILFCVASSLASGQSVLEDRVKVEDATSLMLAAMNAPDGQAKGVLVGRLANEVSRKYGPTKAVLVDVTTVSKLQQEGCSLLKVTFHLVGAQLEGSPKPRDSSPVVQLGLCKDGKQPKQSKSGLPG